MSDLDTSTKGMTKRKDSRQEERFEVIPEWVRFVIRQLGPAGLAIVLTVTPILGLGGLFIYIRYNPSNTEIFMNNMLARVKQLEDDQKDCQVKIEDGQAKLTELQTQNRRLQEQVIAIQSDPNDIPLPTWFKGPQGRILAINEAYERQILNPTGHTIYDLIGNTESAFLPDNIANEHKANDMSVMTTGIMKDTEETFIDQNGNQVKIRVVKYPRKIGNVIVGISGIAIPTDS